MKMGDLAKKPQAAEEVSQSTESEVKQPMRSPTRPQEDLLVGSPVSRAGR